MQQPHSSLPSAPPGQLSSLTASYPQIAVYLSRGTSKYISSYFCSCKWCSLSWFIYALNIYKCFIGIQMDNVFQLLTHKSTCTLLCVSFHTIHWYWTLTQVLTVFLLLRPLSPWNVPSLMIHLFSSFLNFSHSAHLQFPFLWPALCNFTLVVSK